MKINKLRMRNFFSCRDVTVDFDKYGGIVFINGENGNGKSTIFEGVVWGITGRSIRKSTEESMVNNVSCAECIVEVWVNNNVYIKRTRKPTSLEFTVDGENRTREDARHTQKEINDHLRTNYKILLASTCFGQHSEIDFLGSSADDKREIIRNFLNLEEVFEIRDRIKTHKSVASNTRKALSASLEENLQQVEVITKSIEELSKDLPKVPQIGLKTILEREKIVDQLQEEIHNHQKDIKGHRAYIASLESRVKQEPYRKISDCDYCGTKNAAISQYTEEDRAVDLDELESLRKASALQEEYIRDNQKQIEGISIPISSKEYAKLEKAIADKKLISSFKKQIKDLKVREEEIRQESLKVTSTYEVMRFWETAFSEKGLLQYIIKNILKMFNDSCNTYLYHVANGKYYIEFDEQLNETIWTEKRKIIYHSLSGGQKRMINLSVMLALQELLALASNTTTSALFFDEIGENLSEQSLYGLYILLRKLKDDGKQIFLTTHNEKLKSLLDFSAQIDVRMEEGFTVIG